jgi:hypothetical protein
VTRALPALLLVIAGAAAQAREPDALAALAECAAHLDPGGDVGYERIAARCPDLGATLESSPWAPWLPADWKRHGNHLNAQGLWELHDVLLRESSAASGTRVLHPERVRAVLERVMRPERAPESWWARFRRWLRDLLVSRPQEDDSWLRRLLGDAPLDRAMLRLISVLAIALLVVLAAAVVLNELRIAGLLKSRPGRAPRPGVGGPASGAAGPTELDEAAPSAQPALLLGLIAARLVAQDRLPPARAFTVRELTQRARLPGEPERVRLAELAAVSERVRYAEGGAGAPALAAALRGGRELLATLDAAAAVGS